MFTTWERWTYGSIVRSLNDHLQAPLYNNQVDIDGKPGPCHCHGPIGRERWLWYPENEGTTTETREPPQNSMGSYWFIFISFYFPFWWSRIVTSCGIILLTHSSPCCGNLTLKGRTVLYWTLIIVLGTNQHEINMNSTWNQHETNMKPIWNQHERSWHVINMQNIKWQKVASLRTHHWINLSQVPDSKNLPSASEPLTSQFVSAFFSTKYRTTSCLPASTWDPRHYLGPLGRWCQRCGEVQLPTSWILQNGRFFFEDTIGDVWGWYVTIIYYNIILYNPATGDPALLERVASGQTCQSHWWELPLEHSRSMGELKKKMLQYCCCTCVFL